MATFAACFSCDEKRLFCPIILDARTTLIIGPGGGQDVLYALMTGWRHVGVEVNPQIVSLVRRMGTITATSLTERVWTYT